MTTMLHPRIGDRWLTDIGAFSAVVCSESLRRGCEQASWSMNRNFRHSALRAGAPVTMYDGPVPYWTGFLGQAPRDGNFVAYGPAGRGDGVLALDGVLAPTSNPANAVGNAIGRGAVPWIQGGDFLNSDLGENDGSLTLTQLLDRMSQDSPSQWRVDEHGVATTRIPDTTPTWGTVLADDVWTHDDSAYVTHLNVVYLAAGPVFASFTRSTPDSEAAAATWGLVEKQLDLTGQGILTLGQAQDAADALLSRVGARMLITDPIVVAVGQLRNLGDTAAGFARVHCGQMIRLWGIPDQSRPTSTLHTDVVIGRLERTSSTLTLTPADAPAYTYEDIVAEMFAA